MRRVTLPLGSHGRRLPRAVAVHQLLHELLAEILLCEVLQCVFALVEDDSSEERIRHEYVATNRSCTLQGRVVRQGSGGAAGRQEALLHMEGVAAAQGGERTCSDSASATARHACYALHAQEEHHHTKPHAASVGECDCAMHAATATEHQQNAAQER
jgi:hypothetical protein